jgi:predicted secreted protein
MKLHRTFTMALLYACAFNIHTSVAQQLKETTQQPSVTEKTISLKVGEQSTIDVSALFSAGYVWQLNRTYDNTITLCENVVVEPSALIGAPAIYRITIRAINPGQTTFALENKRPWEKEAIEKIVYTIIVEEADPAITHENIALKVGEQVTITHLMRASTGHMWYLKRPYNNVITLKEDIKVHAPTRIGTSADHLLTLTAIQPGETTLMLEYKRAYAKQPLKTIAYTVTVTDTDKG